MKKSTTKKLVLCALFTALTCLATLFISVPLAIGYVHLGDVFVFLSAFVLGPIWGSIAAGLGCALADTVGFLVYAPATLIIKALMVLGAWFTYTALTKIKCKHLLAGVVAGIVGTMIMALGYFVYEWILYANVTVALVNIPWNLLQGTSGFIPALLIMQALKRTKILEKIN